MMKNILLAFIPIFVAVDAIGVLPIFVSFTQDLDKKERSKIIIQSMITAACLAIGFIFVGEAILKFLGITLGDFMVAGGAILFTLAIRDMVSQNKSRRLPDDEVGAVPLGTPLIVGPAVLTTSLLMLKQYGLYPTLTSVIVNILIAGLIFMSSDFLMRFLGKTGSRALSKITALLLAAIAVMLMRKGITRIFNL